MNKVRRITLTKVVGNLEEMKNIVESEKDYEEMSYENLPEGIRDSERGERMYENVESLGDAVDSIDDAITNINNAIN